MVDFVVKQGLARRLATGDTRAEAPLRWARRKGSEALVHVNMLTKDEHGKHSGCCCAACGTELQAVNTDKDDAHFQRDGTLGKFFRHPPGHEHAECHFLTAKLAALQLLMERDEIELPAPVRRREVPLVGGKVLPLEVMGHGFRVKIRNREWLDAQCARITDENGRVILVHLGSSQHLNSEGRLDGVITITVDDPVVATWTPEEILKHAQIAGQLVCWEQHWEDAQLETELNEQLQQLVMERDDLLPLDLAELAGMSRPMQKETALHWKVKEILARAGRLMVPLQHKQLHSWVSDADWDFDNGPSSREVVYWARYLDLLSVQLEQRMPGIVPDVVCTARDPAQPEQVFELLVEVAVHHRVDQDKARKIELQQRACIEIDLKAWKRDGKVQKGAQVVPVARLREIVIDETTCKRWIFNPWFNSQVAAAIQEQKAIAAEKRMHEAAELMRQNWLDTASNERLLDVFMEAMDVYWRNPRGSITVDDEFGFGALEIAQELERRGYRNATDELFMREHGILYCVWEVYEAQAASSPVERLEGLFWMETDTRLREFISLPLTAIKTYHPNLTTDEQNRVNTLVWRVRESLKLANMTYARPNTYDKVLAALFSDMAKPIAKPFGTQKEVNQRRSEAAQEKAEAERRLRAKAQEEEMAQIQRRMREQEELYLQQSELDKVAGPSLRRGWNMQERGRPGETLDGLLQKREIQRLVVNYARSGLDMKDLLQSAWMARQSNVPFYRWYRQVRPTNTATAAMLITALKAASLLEP